MKLVSLTIALMCVSVFLASSVPVVDAAGGSRLTRNTKSAKSNKKYKDDFKYPKDMPPPPEMWVEGFASRLHAQNIQKYETPIQVWQTWRLDQMMWNCVAHYHPTALHAITKSAPVPRVPEEYHTSEARALCMIHAVNKLVPELIPMSKRPWP